MSTHNLSRASSLFAGDVYYARYHTNNSDEGRAKSGLPVDPVAFVNWGAPLALDTNAFVAAATGAELPNAATKTYTTADAAVSPIDDAGLPATSSVIMADGIAYSVWTMDVPRNFTEVTTHSTSIVAMTITVSGFDEYGVAMSELFTVTATGTTKAVAGKKAFKYVKSIAITAAGDATANTLNAGFGDVLGLPFRMDNKNKFIPMGNGAPDASATLVIADDTAATTSTGDVRGTVDFNTASDAAKLFAGCLIPASRSDAVLAFGVTQA